MTADSILEFLKQEISNKNKSINLEVDLISKCGYADEILSRALYLATILAARDALVAFLHDIESKQEEQ
jgi:hypothetical protein